MMITRIAMVIFSYYPSDSRARREAEALIESGMSVDMICLRIRYEPKREIVNGVQVYRIPLKRKRGGKLRYLLNYTYFIFLAFFTLSVFHIRKHYSVVRVHNMPDILIFSALMSRLCGYKVILDLHDPMPEVYMTKYSVSPSHPVVRPLIFLEKLSIWFIMRKMIPMKISDLVLGYIRCFSASSLAIDGNIVIGVDVTQ